MIEPWPETMPDLPLRIEGWGTWDSMFRRLLADRPAPILIEVGSWLGKTADLWCKSFQAAQTYCLDTWQGGPEHQLGQPHHIDCLPYLFEQWQRNLWQYRDRVSAIRARSTEGLTRLGNAGLIPDLIYIDACHLYEAVRADILAALDFEGAIICGDDYEQVKASNGVRAAVEAVAYEHKRKVCTYQRFWWYE